MNTLRRRFTDLTSLFSSNPNPTVHHRTNHHNTDQLSRLPSECILHILSKLDAATLCRCASASPRFEPYLSQLHTLSTPLPSSLILPNKLAPYHKHLPKFLLCAAVILAIVPALAVLYALFSILRCFFPYSCIVLSLFCRRIRRIVIFHLENAIEYAIFYPRIRNVFVWLFGVVRYVFQCRIVRFPLEFLWNFAAVVVVRGIACVYMPRNSGCVRRFFARLDGLEWVDVVLPVELLGNYADFWARAELGKVRDGKEMYTVSVIGNVVGSEEGNGYDDDDVGFWVRAARIWRLVITGVLCIMTVRIVMDELAFARKNVRQVKCAFRKNDGGSARVGLRVEVMKEERVERPEEVKKPVLFRLRQLLSNVKAEIEMLLLGKESKVSVKKCYLREKLVLGDGSLQLEDVCVFVFVKVGDGSRDRDEAKIDNLILSCLADWNDEGSDDDDRRLLKEAIRKCFAHPNAQTFS